MILLRSYLDPVSSMVLALLGDRCRSSMDTALIPEPGLSLLSVELLWEEVWGTDWTDMLSASNWFRLFLEFALWDMLMVT